MGCDIHPYIEYNSDPDCDGRYTFFAAPHIMRDYTLFNLLAGVRGPSVNALYPPRGVPESLSYKVEHEYTLHVTQDDEEDLDQEGYCTYQRASAWVNKGYSKWFDIDHTCVVNPDWHNPSWLNADELSKVYLKYWEVRGSDFLQVKAIIEAMRVLPNARLVFWFDN
jgi:hypothetical protein